MEKLNKVCDDELSKWDKMWKVFPTMQCGLDYDGNVLWQVMISIIFELVKKVWQLHKNTRK